jgi:NitT/TauT family transport system substrate-binding protein
LNSRHIAIASGIGIALIILAIVTIQQTTFHTEPKKEEIRIGYLQLVPSLPIFVAIEKGYFEEEGLAVTATTFQTSNQIAEALINNQIDFGGSISPSVVFAIEGKAPNSMKIISDNTVSVQKPFTALVVSSSSSLGLNDLSEHRRVANFPGSTSVLLSKLAFKKLFGEDFNAEYVQLPPNLWFDSLAHKDVDFLVSYEPFTTLGLEKGLIKVVYPALVEQNVLNPMPGAVNIVSEKLVSENPQSVEKINRAIQKAIIFIKDNESESRKIAAKYIPITESVAMKMTLPEWHTIKEIDVQNYQQYADLLFENGDLEKDVEVSKTLYQGG